jgi:hypothetical protein
MKTERKNIDAIGSLAEIRISLRSHVRKRLHGNVSNSDRKIPGNGSLNLIFSGE